MKTITCDRCGKIIKNIDPVTNNCRQAILSVDKYILKKMVLGSYCCVDLCPECQEGLDAWFLDIKRTEEMK